MQHLGLSHFRPIFKLIASVFSIGMKNSGKVVVGIDESGKTTSRGGHDARNPFFVVAAACIDEHQLATLERGFRLVSRRWFGELANADGFELHAVELVNWSPLYKGITVDQKIGFLDELGRVLRMLHVEVFVRGACKRGLPLNSLSRYSQGVIAVIEEVGVLSDDDDPVDFKVFADSHEAAESTALANALKKIGRTREHGAPEIVHVHSHTNVLIQIADLFAYFTQRRMMLGLGLTKAGGASGKLTDHFDSKVAPIARVDKVWFPKEDVYLSTTKPDFTLVARSAQSIQSRRAHLERTGVVV